MFDVHAYLRSELRRYYPDAARIDVHEGDETWDIGIVLPFGSIIQLHMDVGSDDDYFAFETSGGHVITVPFAPEMSA